MFDRPGSVFKVYMIRDGVMFWRPVTGKNDDAAKREANRRYAGAVDAKRLT